MNCGVVQLLDDTVFDDTGIDTYRYRLLFKRQTIVTLVSDPLYPRRVQKIVRPISAYALFE